MTSGSASSSSRAPTATATRCTRLELAGAEPVALWHEYADLDGVDGGRPARRLRLRRLPARRRHRPVQPGHARRRRVRRGRRPRARDLQRLPGAGRGRPRARRAAAQPRPALRRRARSRSRPSGSTRRSPAAIGARRPLRMPIAHGEGCYFADDATLDALEARRPGPVPLRPRRTGRAGGEDDRANPNGSLRAIAGRDERRAATSRA